MAPTTPLKIEALCLALVPGKGMGWDGMSPRVIKGVSRKYLDHFLDYLIAVCERASTPSALRPAVPR